MPLPQEHTIEEIAHLAGRRAANLFTARRLCCSEAVLLVLNNGFNGGLDFDTARNLGAGFCGGMGDAGCVCGALSGAVMGLGLFLGPAAPNGLNKKKFRALIKNLHNAFQTKQGSTCCRILIQDFSNGKQKTARHNHCTGITEHGGRLAVELLLKARPALLGRADLAFLEKKDTRLTGLLTGKL
ncbi:MAG: C-GCAxxG-C-C family protein [Desulfobacterales bacterium]|nr:C-GCAxxG-C-C family protein [Desulfobacterales bacterium]